MKEAPPLDLQRRRLRLRAVVGPTVSSTNYVILGVIASAHHLTPIDVSGHRLAAMFGLFN